MTAYGGEAMEWLRRRKSSLERARAPHEEKWRELRDYFEPTMGRSLDWRDDMNSAHGKRGDEKIVDPHVRQLVRRLAAGLHSGITNPAREWFRLAPRSKAGRSRAGREYLDRATEAVQSALSGSNVYPSLDSMYSQLAVFGTAAALLVPDEEAIMRLVVLDAGAYWIAENNRGVVDTLMRRTSLTLEQVLEEYGRDALPEWMRQRIDGGSLDEAVTVWNYIAPVANVPEAFLGGFPLEDGPLFASIHFTAGGGMGAVLGGTLEVLAVRPFYYSPILAPRWQSLQGTAYGFGVGEMALGDAKQLQMMDTDKLKLAELIVDPPLAAPESMVGKVFDTGPGGLTFYTELLGAGGMGGNIPVQPLFNTRENIEVPMRIVEDLHIRLDRECYADLFAMMINLDARQGSREMTAAEVAELANEKVTLLGPILMRLNTELLDPLVKAAFEVCFDRAQDDAALLGEDRTGLMDYPEDLLGEDFDIEYQSSIHIAQQMATRMNSMMQIMQYVAYAMQLDPQAVDNLDMDKNIQTIAEIAHEFGAIRSPDEVAAIRQGRAAAQEQQMRLADERQAIDAERTRSEIMKNVAAARQAAGGNALEGAA